MRTHRSWFGALAVTGALVLATGAATVAAGAATNDPVGTLAATAGCGRNPTLNNGTHTISSGGQNRSFILRLPANYNNNTQYRLIVGLHWLNGSASNVANGGYYGMQELSNNTAILVAPQGLNAGWANSGGQDVTFIDNMLTRLENDLCIDTSQRFALGFSYGGGMSYSLACSRPNIFRAVAVFSGAQLSGCSGGTQPVAYFGIHGISDSVLNISQGRSLRDRFVSNNGCTPQSPREPTSGSRTHITTVYSGCRAGYPVQWAAFDGGHIFSPVDGSTADNAAQTWTKNEVWRFFSQFASTTPPPPTSTPPPPTSTPPPPTTTPPPPTTTPPPGQGGCTAAVSLNSWTGGFVATVRVTAGSAAINGWNVAMTLPSGAAVTNTWNASASGSTGSVRFTNVSYNGRVNAGQTTEFGFQGTGSAAGMTPTCTAS
jgi:poly(3-hydroxybutyrate) depolymerase